MVMGFGECWAGAFAAGGAKVFGVNPGHCVGEVEDGLVVDAGGGFDNDSSGVGAV